MRLNDDEKEFVRLCVFELYSDFDAGLFQPVVKKLGSRVSRDLTGLESLLDTLRKRFSTPGAVSISAADAPYIKLCLLLRRQKVAEEQRGLLKRTFHMGIQKNIDEMVTPINNLLADPELSDIEPARLPPLSKFLALKEVYDSMPNDLTPYEPHFDDKFAILLSHNCFLPMLARSRAEAKLRDIELTVAFVDIDDFKVLNTDLSETVVDRQILPILMQEIESHVYSHGSAFKFGGDEYVLLLPNMGKDIAQQFLFDLQKKLAQLSFSGVDHDITVSIGICTISPDTYLTDAEVLDNANHTMRHAKNRKDCLAGFNDSKFENLFARADYDLVLSRQVHVRRRKAQSKSASK